jgi:protein TonB
MPEAGAKAGAFEEALFASVLHARAREARERHRALWLVPLVIVLHALALWALGASRGTSPVALESPRDELVLRLLPAPPPPPPPASSGTSTVARKTVARRPRPFVAPTTVPRPLPEAPEPVEEESLPSEDAVEAGVPGGVPGGVEGGVVGGIVGGVLGASQAGLLARVPPPPTAEERADLEAHYFETMFSGRFKHVRYPHQGAMAGIQGKLTLRITVNGKGQLLDVRVHGPCPHFVLCDAAIEAVRKEAPYPPPPPRLGGRATVYLPFNYYLR